MTTSLRNRPIQNYTFQTYVRLQMEFIKHYYKTFIQSDAKSYRVFAHWYMNIKIRFNDSILRFLFLPYCRKNSVMFYFAN